MKPLGKEMKNLVDQKIKVIYFAKNELLQLTRI